MTGFCLIPSEVNKFRAKLSDGSIDPAKLSRMTSEERHKFFADITGEANAKGVNSLFESKLLLKNQQKGMVTWAKHVMGVTPEVRRDMLSRIERLDKVLNPAEEKNFLKDLASTKLGIDVSAKEAKQIADLSNQVTKTRELQKPDGTFSTEEQRLAYGHSKVALGNYVNDLKHEAEKTGLRGAISHPAKTASYTAGLAKSLKASLDNSAIFRQGWKTLFTNPLIWQKNARQTFIDATKELSGKSVMDEVHADILSRPNYDLYKKMKLATATVEEAYPTSLPAKIPVLGRLYKASESAYTGFVYRQRADIADKMIEIAKKNDINLKDPKELESIGKLVNSLTGRGHLGGLEPAAKTVNNVFFSPRALKSNIDTLTAHQFQKGVTPFVRKQAAESTAKVIIGTAAVLGIANALKPGSVDLDPRSSDFGKIKIGNTRFDVSGGMSSIATLAARLITQSSKSSTTGIVKKLNSGEFGSQTGADVFVSFFENKLSPVGAVIKDLIKQQDFNGNKPTVKGELSNLVVPLPITSNLEAHGDKNGANQLLVGIADGLGIAANTYGQSKNDWAKNTGKELNQFKSKVTPMQFKKANDEYNQKYDEWLKKNKQSIQDQPEDTQQKFVTDAKDQIKKDIFKAYNFKYEASPEEKRQRSIKAQKTRAANRRAAIEAASK